MDAKTNFFCSVQFGIQPAVKGSTFKKGSST